MQIVILLLLIISIQKLWQGQRAKRHVLCTTYKKADCFIHRLLDGIQTCTVSLDILSIQRCFK